MSIHTFWRMPASNANPEKRLGKKRLYEEEDEEENEILGHFCIV